MSRLCPLMIAVGLTCFFEGGVFAIGSLGEVPTANAQVLPPLAPEVPMVLLQRSGGSGGGAWEYRLFADGYLWRRDRSGPSGPEAAVTLGSSEVDRLLNLVEVSGLLEWNESDIRRRVAELGRPYPKGTDLARVRIELNFVRTDIAEPARGVIKTLIEAPWPALLRYKVPELSEFKALDDMVRTLEAPFLAEASAQHPVRGEGPP